MPWILLLPERKWIKIDGQITVKKLLDKLGFSDPDEVAVVVNNKLVEDPEYIIGAEDDVKIIKQGIGG